MANIAPYIFIQEHDNNGDPLAGGKVYTYEAGTTTPKATYTTSAGDVPNANPVTLDSAGRADIWLGDGGYKFVLKTSADVTIKTVDNIGGQASTAFAGTVYDISSNTVITATYANALLVCTASPTITMPTVADVTEGFYIIVRNDGAGTVTIDPDGAETINNGATFDIPAGFSATIVCDGDEWFTVGHSANYATLTGSETLTNKTLTSPTINDGTCNLDGGTLILPQGTSTAPTAEGSIGWDTDDNLLKIGDGSGTKTFVDTDTAQTLTNKTLSTGSVFPAGTVIKRTVGTYTTNAALATAIPLDDTIPTNTEGTQIISVSHTPRTTTNRLRATFTGYGGNSVSGYMSACLYLNSGAAVQSAIAFANTGNSIQCLAFQYEWVPGSTSSQTINVRAGANTGTMRLNGDTTGRYHGGISASVLVIEEIEE